jgi:sigma-B regulation protein RsbU (phosphoserine phosphatase)
VANDDDARDALERIEPAFLLPLTFDPFAHGAQQPHEPREPDVDLRLLQATMTQMGFALENGRLLEQIAIEIATREKHKRELEIARDVQQALFPQHHPAVAGLEYAGACRPALEVGGDYYDFLTISPREFGIAIGDVSGKGVSASLLMATLRAYLHGHAEAIHRDIDLPSLMTNLNRFVYASSPANRYATFFYAQHDTSTRVLTYVNGGHNAPLLFRAADAAAAADADDEPVRLQTGGPVIGLLPACAYVQEQIVLHPGDLLVLFTDGVSEAITRADEEWGEDRLIAAIRHHRHAPPQALIDGIMASVDAFVADAPQFDDMTLVVIRAV